MSTPVEMPYSTPSPTKPTVMPINVAMAMFTGIPIFGIIAFKLPVTTSPRQNHT